MPGGASSPVIGYAVFGAIKFTGYSLAARFISKRYPDVVRNPFVVGGARTLIGVGAGACYIALLSLLPREAVTTGGVLFLLGLVPMRIIEWWLLLWLFYDRKLDRRSLGWRIVALATLWSFALDVPAIAGAFFTGGFWIC